MHLLVCGGDNHVSLSLSVRKPLLEKRAELVCHRPSLFAHQGGLCSHNMPQYTITTRP